MQLNAHHYTQYKKKTKKQVLANRKAKFCVLILPEETAVWLYYSRCVKMF